MKYLPIVSLTFIAGLSPLNAHFDIDALLKGPEGEAKVSLARRAEKLEGESKKDFREDPRFGAARDEKKTAVMFAKMALDLADAGEKQELSRQAIELYASGRRAISELQIEKDVAMLPGSSKDPRDWVRELAPSEDEIAYNLSHRKNYHEIKVLPEAAFNVIGLIVGHIKDVRSYFDQGECAVMSGIFLLPTSPDMELTDPMIALQKLPVDEWTRAIEGILTESIDVLERDVPGFKNQVRDFLRIYEAIRDLNTLTTEWEALLLKRKANLEAPEEDYEAARMSVSNKLEAAKRILNFLPAPASRVISFMLVPNFVVPPVINRIVCDEPIGGAAAEPKYTAKDVELLEDIRLAAGQADDEERRLLAEGKTRGGESVTTYAKLVAKPLYPRLMERMKSISGVEERNVRFFDVNAIKEFYDRLKREGRVEVSAFEEEQMDTALRRASIIYAHTATGFNPQDLLLYTFGLLGKAYAEADDKGDEALLNLLYASFSRLAEQNNNCAIGFSGRAFQICSDVFGFMVEQEKKKEGKREEAARSAANLRAASMGNYKVNLPPKFTDHADLDNYGE